MQSVERLCRQAVSDASLDSSLKQDSDYTPENTQSKPNRKNTIQSDYLASQKSTIQGQRSVLKN